MILNDADRKVVNTMVALLLTLNDRDDSNSSQSGSYGTYGHVYNALKAFVFNATDIDIGNADWNIGGYNDHADGIQAAIRAEWNREATTYILRLALPKADVRIARVFRIDDEAIEWAETYLKVCGKDEEGRSYENADLIIEEAGGDSTVREWQEVKT